MRFWRLKEDCHKPIYDRGLGKLDNGQGILRC